MKRMLAMMLGGLILAGMVPDAAAERGVNGFILGAGGGAALGQAIGRNTEATLIGTAVGGMLGYIVGNELDKQGGQQLAGASGTVVIHSVQDRGYLHDGWARHQYRPAPDCRETEMLAMVNGRPEVVVGTACWQNGGWVLANDYRRATGQVVVIRNYQYGPSYRMAGPPPAKGWRKNQHRDHYRR
jgi:hypothetical protein